MGDMWVGLSWKNLPGLVNYTKNYLKSPFIVDLPNKNGDFP